MKHHHPVRRLLRAWLFGGLLLVLAAGCASVGPPELATEEFRVASDQPDLTLYVRNKRHAGQDAFAPGKILLFVHGATFPSESTFDLRLGETSWMEYLAQRGYDVYLMDIRGYGRSSRPAAMDSPPEGVPAFGGMADALKDVDSVVDFIRRRRGVERLNLMGWSWGTLVMGHYTSLHNEKVNKLVMYAPAWRRQPTTAAPSQAVPAWRAVNVASVKQRWLTGVPAAKAGDLIPPGWFEAWVAATQASDPDGARRQPPVIRVPNGVAADAAGRRDPEANPYEAGNIRVPVLLVKAEWDADTPSYMAQAIFAKLVNAPARRYVELAEGTHSIMLEKNRMALFREVQSFLDDVAP